MKTLAGKKIILGVCGSIAAYKAPLLVRELITHGADVHCVMTPSAQHFCTPLALQNTSKNSVIRDMFDEKLQQNGSWHIHLARSADAMLIAPCSATTLSRLATGACDTALSSLAIALPRHIPLILAPAMDTDMWEHPAVQRSLSLIKSDGTYIIEPETGELASGIIGKGRLPAPATIVEQLIRLLSSYNVQEKNSSSKEKIQVQSEEDSTQKLSVADLIHSHKQESISISAELELVALKRSLQPETVSLAGKKVLITAGPTFEPIDAVRFVGNHSSGKMGFALAEQAQKQGAIVTLIAGPVSLPTPEGVTRINCTSAQEMFAAVQENFGNSDIAIFAAAVADFTPETIHSGKTKKEAIGAEWHIRLVPTPDILAWAGTAKTVHQKIIGFALETDNPLENAEKKLRKKNCNMLVLNEAGKPDSGFGTDTNTITLLFAEKQPRALPTMSKQDCAKVILQEILQLS